MYIFIQITTIDDYKNNYVMFPPLFSPANPIHEFCDPLTFDKHSWYTEDEPW